MPGLLQIEAIVQIAALAILTLEGNKGKVMYLSKLTDSKFNKKVICTECPYARLFKLGI